MGVKYIFFQFVIRVPNTTIFVATPRRRGLVKLDIYVMSLHYTSFSLGRVENTLLVLGAFSLIPVEIFDLVLSPS